MKIPRRAQQTLKRRLNHLNSRTLTTGGSYDQAEAAALAWVLRNDEASPPTTPEEAVAMIGEGIEWLQAHAPDVLRPLLNALPAKAK